MGDGGPFHRKHKAPLDKRFVARISVGEATPSRWTDTDLTAMECKFMEVRKFSSDYFELETKFRRPNLEMITAFAIQNPFLWGEWILRREQMKQQGTGNGCKVKEKDFFYATDTSTFETIARYNFDARFETNPQLGVPFYTDAMQANSMCKETNNVRLMFLAKVLVGTCAKREEGSCTSLKINQATNLPVDTFTISSMNVFYKYRMAETYPGFLIVYRDTRAGGDARPPHISLSHCRLSYRQGTRFNPQINPNWRANLKESQDQEGQEDEEVVNAAIFVESGIVVEGEETHVESNL